jgi:hypothetical protein
MAAPKKHEQTVCDAIAARFGATRDGVGGAKAYIKVAGKRVALDILSLKVGRAAEVKATKPHLRFDKVVVWLIERLRSTFSTTVPDGVTVVVTVTAPIRIASKTAAAIEEKVHAVLPRGSRSRDHKYAIHGNQVQIRLLTSKGKRAPKLIGFVHNPESDPLPLVEMTRELLSLNDAKRSRKPRTQSSDRWLVLISHRSRVYLQAYRSIYSQLGYPTNFKKALMVFADGRVEDLSD